MPTGYTAKIAEGKPQTFEEFALSCARAFNALVMMHDDPSDAPIPDEFKPSDYHQKALHKAEMELAEFKSLSNDELRQRQKREHDKHIKWLRDYKRKNAELNARYAAMLEQVQAWTPPTEEHVGLKKFMVEQLTISMNRDDDDPEPEMAPFDQWKATALAGLERDVEYQRKSWFDELKRTAERGQWVRQLRSSLR